MNGRSLRILVLLLVALGLVGAACGDDDDDTIEAASETTTTAEAVASTTTTAAQTTTTTAPDPGVSGDVTVFAAASLTDAFTEIGDAFTEANPDAEVVFNFDASSGLVTQITEGAPADVFASADTNNMTKLTDAGLNGGEPAVFATNLLQIITAAGNPLGITGVADLANPDLIVVTCAPEVPIGRYSAEVFAKAGVTVVAKSLEENVRAVVNKVTIGEADAGIVYVTDVTAAGDRASGVEIPEDLNVVATYPIATTAEAPNAEAADVFVEFVLSEEGRSILESYGFGAP